MDTADRAEAPLSSILQDFSFVVLSGTEARIQKKPEMSASQIHMKLVKLEQ